MGWLRLVGTGISALSQMSAGDDAAAAARADGALKAGQIRKLAVNTRSSARAALAASGVDVNSPSSKVIDSSIQSESEQDAMNAILSGGRAASVATTASRMNALGTGLSALNSDYGQSALSKVQASFGRWKTAGPGGVGAPGSGSGY